MALTPQQHTFYAKNGYLVVENVLTGDMLTQLRGKITEMAAAPTSTSARKETEGVAPNAPLRKLSALVPVDSFFKNIASLPSITGPACELTESTAGLLLYNDQVFLKPAHCGSEKPLHQDNSYFRVEPMSQGVTCWLAIDNATIHNGCMQYIAGSHKLGLLPHKEIKNTPHLMPEDPKYIGTETPVPIPAGACIFHHLLSLHSSKGNTSDQSRRAWAMHFVNAQASCPNLSKDKMTAVT